MIPALAVCGAGLGLVVAPLVNIILGGIHAGSAGSASGVLTTVQQVGGALGVAIIGIIFFGQVSGYAPVVAQGTAAQLSAQLIAAGVPPQQASATAQMFSRCFVAQSTSADPSATPPGCPALSSSSGAPQPAARIIALLARQAVAENFDHAFRDALFFEMGAFALVFLMVFALPQPRNLYGPRPAG
jgi:hypothetical protein